MCDCERCKTHNMYKWAVVTECKCACHSMDGCVGHDKLCCAYPNALQKNNPHEKLENSEFYKKDLDPDPL